MDGICKWCGKGIQRRGRRKPVFCSIQCKAEWQRTQKPISKDNLYKFYVVDGLGTYQISQIVGRDPKRVYEWLRDYGIPIREREWDVTPGTKPYHGKVWLRREYLEKQRSAKEIAGLYGVTENNILFFLAKFGIPRRQMDEIRLIKYWGASGQSNPMYGRRGAENPNWKGGMTPERQAFYQSEVWKQVSQRVWKRDKANCQRCGVHADGVIEMHIHHVISFAVEELRVNPLNLVLLCRDCHNFVHSTANTAREFLEKENFFDHQ
jgi:hypothetical protein